MPALQQWPLEVCFFSFLLCLMAFLKLSVFDPSGPPYMLVCLAVSQQDNANTAISRFSVERRGKGSTN